ncbi:hypothetical protein ANANG_G00130130 [Anguilla anguilla]|uniref:Semaphorin-1A n=1 Tax=Anguilla anguilla TaxID=7936 RepID=A0A9D3MKF3_ANGAN|nr:hypothetical protein ANANG_G00130130 [Anguilla anguilla]
MVVIEEVQLFQAPEPIKILRLSSGKGLLYAGADSGVVQMPLSECGRHASCLDCVLSRDPYCAWDPPSSRCVALSGLGSPRSGDLIQNVADGDASLCPNSAPDPVRANVSLVPGSNINLPCRPRSNRARVRWHLSGRPLPPPQVLRPRGGADGPGGHARRRRHLHLPVRGEGQRSAVQQDGGGVPAGPGAGGDHARVEARVQGARWYPCRFRSPCSPSSWRASRNCVEEKPLMSVTNYNAHNNRLTLAASNGEGTPSPKVAVDTFQYIDDESEI